MLRLRLIHVSKSGDTCVICSDCLRAIEERLSEAHLIRGCRSVGWQLGLLGVSQMLSGFTFSSLWPGDAMWRHRWQNWIRYGFVLHTPMLTYHQAGPLVLTKNKFTENAQNITSYDEFAKHTCCKITSTSLRGQWVLEYTDSIHA